MLQGRGGGSYNRGCRWSKVGSVSTWNRTMTPPRSNKSLVLVLWANAGLLAMILIVLLNRGSAPSFLSPVYGQNQAPIAGGGGGFIMPRQMQTNVWGCYLLDVDAKTLCAYQFYPGEKKLRLTAARSYRYDTKLENYNTELSPREIKALLDKQGMGAAPQEPAPAKEKDK